MSLQSTWNKKDIISLQHRLMDSIESLKLHINYSIRRNFLSNEDEKETLF